MTTMIKTTTTTTTRGRTLREAQRRARIWPTSRLASCAPTGGRTCQGFLWDLRWHLIADNDRMGGGGEGRWVL
jgi:hypothetical protein